MGQKYISLEELVKQYTQGTEPVFEEYPEFQIVNTLTNPICLNHIECQHEEVMRQGNGAVYGVCKKCGIELF